MPQKDRTSDRRAWCKQYVIGLALGVLAVAYGVFALVSGQAYMPGFTARDAILTGRAAQAMAVAFLSGGAYLFLRFFLEERLRKSTARAQLYVVQVVLLISFIGSLLYVLFKGSEVGGV